MKRIIRFALVGGMGFLADAAALSILIGPVGPFGGRVLSIAFALGVTWLLNRYVTFGPSSREPLNEGVRYGAVGVAAAVLNYAVYSGLLLAIPSFNPFAALVAASLAAMAFSYAGYSRLVFDR